MRQLPMDHQQIGNRHSPFNGGQLSSVQAWDILYPEFVHQAFGNRKFRRCGNDKPCFISIYYSLKDSHLKIGTRFETGFQFREVFKFKN